MNLKIVLADIKVPFQLIPERQRNPIHHDGGRADNKRGMIPKDTTCAVPGFSLGWRRTGLIAFGAPRVYCGGSHAILWVPGVCLSVLEAKKRLHACRTVAKHCFSRFTHTSAQQPTNAHALTYIDN